MCLDYVLSHSGPVLLDSEDTQRQHFRRSASQTRLGSFELAFVAPSPVVVERCEAAFAAFIARGDRDAQLREFFGVHSLYDTGRSAELSMDELRVLRAGRARCHGERFDGLYRRWNLDLR
jgi:hypothetical protein